jgi:hypothetical protein
MIKQIYNCSDTDRSYDPVFYELLFSGGFVIFLSDAWVALIINVNL